MKDRVASNNILQNIGLYFLFFTLSGCNNNVDTSMLNENYNEKKDISMNINLTNDECDFTDCYIYYDEFDIERIFGLQESQIDDFIHIKKYPFNEDDLRVIIEEEIDSSANMCNNFNYCNIDVKAKIILNNAVYYIDSNGFMKADDKYFKINKKKLKKIIESKKAI